MTVILAVATALGVVHARALQVRAAAADRMRERRAADSVAAATPHLAPLLDQTLAINAGGYYASTFTVLPGQLCTVVGDAASVNAGSEFEMLLLTEDEALRWEANPVTARLLWRSGETLRTTVSAPVPAAGRYTLVVSNKAAWLLRHMVQAKADLRCTHQWVSAPLGE